MWYIKDLLEKQNIDPNKWGWNDDNHQGCIQLNNSNNELTNNCNSCS